MNSLVLDTDTVSRYRKGRLPASQLRHVEGSAICLSFPTVGELHRWAIVHRWGAASLGGFELWLTQNLRHFTDFAEHDGLRLLVA